MNPLVDLPQEDHLLEDLQSVDLQAEDRREDHRLALLVDLQAAPQADPLVDHRRGLRQVHHLHLRQNQQMTFQ